MRNPFRIHILKGVKGIKNFCYCDNIAYCVTKTLEPALELRPVSSTL